MYRSGTHTFFSALLQQQRAARKLNGYSGFSNFGQSIMANFAFVILYFHYFVVLEFPDFVVTEHNFCHGNSFLFLVFSGSCGAGRGMS
jgi:hypothetical protein